MSGLARIGAWLLGLAAAQPAWAQQVGEAMSPAARCLVTVAGAAEAPEYPFVAFKGGRRGAVQVLLEFDAPDRPPRVQVQERTDELFEQAVVAHARHLRVPCLRPEDGTARLLRDYVFRSDDERVQWFSAVDARGREDARLLACRTHVKGLETPEYPAWGRHVGEQGRLLAEVRFVAADQPPVVTLHGRRNMDRFRDSVESWLVGLRLPCHAGRPVSATFQFVFVMEGEAGYGFRNVPFVSLLASTVGIEKLRLEFDTRTMGCPFEVQWHYRQPHLRNLVGELDSRDPARRPLLEWMETIELKLPSRSLDSVYGDSTRITVPCVHVNLKPKE
jgi:hypothetical protein